MMNDSARNLGLVTRASEVEVIARPLRVLRLKLDAHALAWTA
jgi:hypothetical protein